MPRSVKYSIAVDLPLPHMPTTARILISLLLSIEAIISNGAKHARPEFVDNRFIEVANGGEARNARLHKFARKADDSTLIDGVNHFWSLVERLIGVSGDIFTHIITADLIGGLSEHLMAAKCIGFGGTNVALTNVAINNASKLDGNEIKEFSGIFLINLAIKISAATRRSTALCGRG